MPPQKTSHHSDFYHPIAHSYTDYGNEAITDWKLGFLNVYKHLLPVKGKVILDYGCGTGKFCRFLRDKGVEVIGVDISNSMLDIARSMDSRNIYYHLINSGHLEFIPSNSIDSITINFVLCILNTQAEITKIVKELQRILKCVAMLAKDFRPSWPLKSARMDATSL